MRTAYDEYGWEASDFGAVGDLGGPFVAEEDVEVRGARRENRDGDGTRKSRYWSSTWVMRSCVPSFATSAASSSRIVRGRGDVKFR